MRRIWTWTIALLLTLCILPGTARAAEVVAEGTCGAEGDNLTWVLTDDGVLTISGEGDMQDYNIVGYFYHQGPISSIIIENGVTSIGTYAFRDCIDVTDVTIPESVISIDNYAFWSCRSMNYLAIPDSVTRIGESAFFDCTSLVNLSIPESVTSIGKEAFRGCTSLTSVIICNSEITIDEDAFIFCDNLEYVSFPAGMTTIGTRWFGWCSSLTTVDIPDSVTAIENEAFLSCTSLVSVNIPGSVTSIGESAFKGCISLDNIAIPDSVTTIGDDAFRSCRSLTYVSIPDSIATVGSSVFRDCIALTNMIIPDSVTSIGRAAFMGCSNLKSVKIPNGVTTIEGYAFSDCSSLISIDLPESITYTGDYAFNNCVSLDTVYFRGDVTSGRFNTFWNVTATAYYPADNGTWTAEERQRYGGTLTWVPYEAWELVDKDLKDILNDAESMTPDEIKEAVQEMDTEALEEAMMVDEDNSGVVGDLIALEEAAGGPAAVEVTENKTGIDAEDVTIVGANLNQSNGEGDITLVISSPSKENELPKGYRKNAIAIQFSMDLANVEDPENLSVPVKITMPVPKRIKPENLIILHYHSDGAVEEIHPEITLVDEQYYASFVLTSFSDFIFTETPIIRIAGSDRIATSLMLADQLKDVLGVEKFDAVVVASALNFPDALTGSYLAAEKNAPILLTYPAAHAKIRAYIQENLKPGGMVYILGGEGAVSADFAVGLDGFNIKRLAGSDRFGTNLAIMEEAGVSADQPVLIATAVNFADSLSASAAGLPMVLVYGSLREDQKEFLATTSKNFIIIGGEAAVSKSLENELATIGSVTRVAGSSRYETSVLVAERFVQNPDAVILAYARNFPDGLCGGPLAYALGAPLILTDNSGYSTADTYVSGISAGIVVGGAGLISDETANQIFDK